LVLLDAPQARALATLMNQQKKQPSNSGFVLATYWLNKVHFFRTHDTPTTLQHTLTLTAVFEGSQNLKISYWSKFCSIGFILHALIFPNPLSVFL
jgi:hypothetical protein